MKGKNVILVEDILDTGLTLTYLKKLLLAHQPAAFKIAALLDKPSRRKMPIQGDYVGFTIPDEFVVGYGLDYAERYRSLPDVCSVCTTISENPRGLRRFPDQAAHGCVSRSFGVRCVLAALLTRVAASRVPNRALARRLQPPCGTRARGSSPAVTSRGWSL